MISSTTTSIKDPTQTQSTMSSALDVSLETDDGKYVYCNNNNNNDETSDNPCLYEDTNEAAKLDLSEIGKSSSC